MTEEMKAFWWFIRWGVFWTLVILIFGFNLLSCTSPADPKIEEALEEVLKKARITMKVSPNPLVTEYQINSGLWLPMTIRFTEHEGVSAQLYNFGCETTFIGTYSRTLPIDFDNGKLDANGSLEFFKPIYIYPADGDPVEVEIWGQFTDENGHDIEVAKTIRVEL